VHADVEQCLAALEVSGRSLGIGAAVPVVAPSACGVAHHQGADARASRGDDPGPSHRAKLSTPSFELMPARDAPDRGPR
jgi:hypothetical protein